jgi:DNA-binding Xre family transcriptional regulator
MKIIIHNRIKQKLDEYKSHTGISKTHIAEKMFFTSRQNMYALAESDNLSYDTLIKFSYILSCKIDNLVQYEVIDDGVDEWSKEVKKY